MIIKGGVNEMRLSMVILIHQSDSSYQYKKKIFRGKIAFFLLVLFKVGFMLKNISDFTPALCYWFVRKCTITTPQAQKMQVKKMDKAYTKGEADRYLSDDKVVRVVHIRKKYKKFALCHCHFSRRIRKTNLRFLNVVKNYANIRWMWQDVIYGTLKTKSWKF